jgi:alkanesulfonate monooxygenase SsuD/methylene tetrahydromethanopterin reductase-like flavin-dependent oxidoreductase (luciferase family)
MQFGFTLKPEHSIERTLALTRQAEAAGFAYGWLFDSHVLWRDPYPLLTLMAGVTETMRLGTCVTNPGTREPSVTASALATLDEISGGRMDLGIGRGDSARRVLGKPPITMADTETAVRVIRSLVAGEHIEYEGTDLHFPWTGGWSLPIWVAGYGPMALAMTGRIADGVILQLADPDLITWFAGQVGDRACTDALVPGARLQPRRRPGQQVPARAAARLADGLHHRSDRLRLPAPCRGRLVECRVRRRRGDRSLLHPGRA